MRARLGVAAFASLLACGGRVVSPEATVVPLVVGTDAVRADDAGASSSFDEPGDHRLRLVARHGVPVATAMGIACDGPHVWLTAAAQNGLPPTLSYVELTTSKIVKQYPVGAPTTRVFGVTLLDRFLYVSVMDPSNAILRLAAADGQPLQTFAGPAELGPCDLDASDGRVLESDGTGKVFALSPTGAVISELSAGRMGRNHGLAVRRKEAFVGGLFGGMDTFDIATGARLGTVTMADGSEPRGSLDVGPMCFNGPHLLILSRLGISEYELLPRPAWAPDAGSP